MTSEEAGRQWFEVFYGGVILWGLTTKLAPMFIQNMVISGQIALTLLAFGIVGYYWIFDTWKPGYARKYPTKSPLEIILVILLSASFVGLFEVAVDPLRFAMIMPAMYLFDAGWSLEHGRKLKKKQIKNKKVILKKKLMVAVFNAMAAITFLALSALFYYSMTAGFLIPKIFCAIIIFVIIFTNEALYSLASWFIK